MIKVAPVLIEFGDGDTRWCGGLTVEGDGCIALCNTEPGEIGRMLDDDFPMDRVGAYIVFKNTKSLDCFIESLKGLRDRMVEEK